ncbi:MMPL family transporter [Cohnella faecalis]|uniref:MMPL family transporter n=1 Tax=Cohnella faecalis TaxID=2315694 RepID=A0A398CLL7_9BACL|nr:MMPL family transporter [Cohnella faecalis]RIE02109.1 MMPL family transporter [Cohnella faecalis]
MKLHDMLGKWGRFVYRARIVIVALWIILFVLGASVFGKLPAILSGGGWEITGATSTIANEKLASGFEGRSASSLTLVLRDAQHKAGTAAYNDKLRQVVERLKTEEGVTDVFSILDASDSVRGGLIGDDPYVSTAIVDMNIEFDYLINQINEYQDRVAEQAKSLGVEAYLVGTAAFQGENSAQSQEGLAKAEMIVFPLIIVILLLVFRSFVAMLTPLLVTIASVIVAMGVIYAAATQTELSVFVTNAAMMLGLGVGIDYSLFIVSRFKQELERDNTAGALAKTLATAGHTVLFSAITVIAALSALFVVPMPVIRAIAFGGIAVVFIAGLASLSLLPAVLGMLGARINKGRIPFLNRPRQAGTVSGWRRWTNAIMRRPALFLIVTLGALFVAAIPAVGMKLYSPDIRMLPAETGVRQGFTVLEKSFGVGSTSPLTIVLDQAEGSWAAPEALKRLAALQAELEKHDHVLKVTSFASMFQGMTPEAASQLLQANDGAALPGDVKWMISRYLSGDGHKAIVEVEMDQYGSSDAAREVAKQFHDKLLPSFDLPAGTTYSIGGETMSGMDTSNAIKDSLLPALGVMLILIFVILVLTFRSILLPLKAIVMNLFSVAATFGILVFVFANGHGSELFGVESNGYIIHFVPVLLLALLFGLSTDYEVFLVSRIKEEYDRTGKNEESIAEGMEKTGPLITGAGVLMFAVFAGFAFSGVLPIQMLGFGMAIAIAIDATVIRLLLVPVAMKLLGRSNWWFPGRKTAAYAGNGYDAVAPVIRVSAAQSADGVGTDGPGSGARSLVVNPVKSSTDVPPR